jgi:hypothetical protein
VQGPDLIPPETSASLPGSACSGEKNSADRTLALSVTPKEQTKYLKRRGEARKSQLHSNGKTSDLSSQRLLLSKAPEEEMAQPDQRPIEPKRGGEAHKC